MRSVTLALLASAVALSAAADPLVKPGGKPGAAKAWTSTPAGLELTLQEGFGAEAVGASIEKGVPGAHAKVVAGKVVVAGVETAKLLAALERVDVSADDVDAMVQALQGVGGDDASGSSIRATSKVDFSQVVNAEAPPASGRVVSVKHGKYPFVAVTVKLDAAPKGVELGGREVTVVPRVVLQNGVIAPTDERSKLNIGAWYVRVGDRVRVSLEGRTQQGFWVARAFERAAP